MISDLMPMLPSFPIVLVLTIVAVIYRLSVNWGMSRSTGAPAMAPKKPEKPKLPGVIAYKKANISDLRVIDQAEQRIHLELSGVNGATYASDDEAEDHCPSYLPAERRVGFHAYRSFADARGHAQPGDVLLEVLLSGDVEVHAKGYLASHQRVLQILYVPGQIGVGFAAAYDDHSTLISALATIPPALRRRALARDLAMHGGIWTDQHGTPIVFAPTKAVTRGQRTCEAFVPTALPAQSPKVPAAEVKTPAAA